MFRMWRWSKFELARVRTHVVRVDEAAVVPVRRIVYGVAPGVGEGELSRTLPTERRTLACSAL